MFDRSVMTLADDRPYIKRPAWVVLMWLCIGLVAGVVGTLAR